MLKRNTELATSSATSAKTVYSSTRSRGPTARTYFCFRGGCRAPATESVVELDMDNFFPREGRSAGKVAACQAIAEIDISSTMRGRETNSAQPKRRSVPANRARKAARVARPLERRGPFQGQAI